MTTLSKILNDEHGGPAAEFALVLPVALMFLLGTIDVGRYMWEVNRAQKAAQMATRLAVATDVVASGLANYDFATECSTPGGDSISLEKFSSVTCTGSGSATAPSSSCVIPDATTCDSAIPTDSNSVSYKNILDRARMFKNDIQPQNLTVSYSNSGIGFAGFPERIDVSPIVTVQISNLQFHPLLLTLFGGSLDFPLVRFSLTLEDGKGTVSN